MTEAAVRGIFEWLIACSPARLKVEQVALRLGTTVEGVYILTSVRLLRPSGKPPPNGTKYYSRTYIQRLCEDEAWLDRMCIALVAYKWKKNHAQAIKATTPQPDKSRAAKGKKAHGGGKAKEVSQ